jgi:hypothetical protein
MLYFGRVTRRNLNDYKLHVKIQELGGSHEFGPLPVASPAAYLPSGGTNSAYVGHHGYHYHLIDYNGTTYLFPYAIGDLVIVGQIGNIKEDLIVLGRVKKPTPPWTGSNT